MSEPGRPQKASSVKPRRQPWKKLSRGAIVDYRVVQVSELQVEDPRDGKVYSRVLIEAPEWVTVIPVTTSGKVLLVRQFRVGIWADALETPGGMAEPGESPAATAARELEEETGYRAQELIPLGFCHPNPTLQNNRFHVFLGLGCERIHEGRLDHGEDIELVEVERAEIPKMMRDGRISHALILAAFHLESLRPK